MKAMEHTNDSGATLLGTTAGLWLMQKFFWLAGAFTIGNLASVATVIAGVCSAVFYIYSTYKKSKEK
jgi:hypothetical protein